MLFVFVASRQLVIMGRACIPRACTPASILHRIESKFLCLFLLDEVSLFVYVPGRASTASVVQDSLEVLLHQHLPLVNHIVVYVVRIHNNAIYHHSRDLAAACCRFRGHLQRCAFIHFE